VLSGLALATSIFVAPGNAASGGSLQARRSGASALEEAVVGRINAVRRGHGLSPLRLSPRLAAAADHHSRDMAQQGYFAHTSASGTLFWRRIQRFYPRASHFWSVGENLLWSSRVYDADFAVREWMSSPPHRKNLLSDDWREVGVGAVHVPSAPGAYQGRAVTILTADFGARS
jgi:uncharacterized protein YkwD